MPVIEGWDKFGPFFRWQPNGKRVYFDPDAPASRRRARKQAIGQGRAITENMRKKQRRNREG